MPALDGLRKDWIRGIEAVELLAHKIAVKEEPSTLLTEVRRKFEEEKSVDAKSQDISSSEGSALFSEVFFVSDSHLSEAKWAISGAIQQGSLDIFLHHRELPEPLRIDLDTARQLHMFSEKSFLSFSNFRADTLQRLNVPVAVGRSIVNRPGFTGGQNSRRIAHYGTDTKEEDLEAVFP